MVRPLEEAAKGVTLETQLNPDARSLSEYSKMCPF